MPTESKIVIVKFIDGEVKRYLGYYYATAEEIEITLKNSHGTIYIPKSSVLYWEVI